MLENLVRNLEAGSATADGAERLLHIEAVARFHVQLLDDQLKRAVDDLRRDRGEAELQTIVRVAELELPLVPRVFLDTAEARMLQPIPFLALLVSEPDHGRDCRVTELLLENADSVLFGR